MRYYGIVTIVLIAIGALVALRLAPASAGTETKADTKQQAKEVPSKLVVHTDAEWRKILSPEEYRVLRQKDTERPFTGRYWNLRDDGTYVCAGCGQPLFKSSTKFDAGCGWPSFSDAIKGGHVKTRLDTSMGMRRIEVYCAHCGGHLGHVFDDGPAPTHLRYCINSASLHFVKKEPKPAAKAKSGEVGKAQAKK